MTGAERALVDALIKEPFALNGTSDTRREIGCLLDNVRRERMPPEAERTLKDLSERAANAEKARVDFAAKSRAPSSLVERIWREAIDKAWEGNP